MFIRYIKDMKSWILFFIGAIGFINLIIWLDQGIAVEITSALYFNMLILLSFIVFILWRYRVETKFTKELASLIEAGIDEWHIALPDSTFSHDEVTKKMLHQAAESFSNELSEMKKVNIHEGDYIASWVHEVKTPLTAMKLTIDEHRGDPAFRKIESEWLRLHLLVDQQLSISRLASIETDYVIEKTNLQKLASAEVRELASWCMDKNVAVEFEGDNVEVVTDVKWCRFMIRQFLTNAVKYSPEGGTIIIETKIKSSRNASMSITDEGPGIKPHDLPRIFDKGFTGGTGRIHNAATGLGLYLAQTVAVKMGILLEARSNEAKGTKMEVVFPTENEFDKMLT
ncbi:sensor histidine kinase [Sporosarcina sp. Marseille-Q4063]|uniref:sensor histidine kinase n=1 Tax=Sporosarcina sp. Marseille-Q4063 TaxID=2810514 RepID=UPI001BAFEA13|nr:sensor histidine kinase [Sporosarcina sp. Marseille-Q4063]QUW21012.1 sensor histidine kinase [Sporosarcina sp. Marseille-Q4063]